MTSIDYVLLQILIQYYVVLTNVCVFPGTVATALLYLFQSECGGEVDFFLGNMVLVT